MADCMGEAELVDSMNLNFAQIHERKAEWIHPNP
jgi:hypothetical protein